MGRIDTQRLHLNISQARQIFRYLKRGVVPPKRIRDLTVGFEKEMSLIDAAFKDVRDGIGRYLFIEGKLGGGKSHLLRIAESMAIRENFAVTTVVFDGDIHAFNHPQRYLHRMFENLTIPKLNSKGLSASVCHWLSTDKRQALLDWARNSAPLDMRKDIQFLATSQMEGSPYYELCKKRLDCRDIQFRASARYILQERLSPRAQLCRIVGLNGLLVLFDEVESISILLTNPRSRLISYGILEELAKSGQFRNCLFLFGVTPDFDKKIQDDDEDWHDYYLETYSEGCSFMKKWMNNSYDEMTIEMAPKDENIRFCKKLRDVHALAYSWAAKVKISDSFIQDFIYIHYARNSTQREIVRSFVDILEICQQHPSCHPSELLPT
jgi:hypothetical protein